MRPTGCGRSGCRWDGGSGSRSAFSIARWTEPRSRNFTRGWAIRRCTRGRHRRRGCATCCESGSSRSLDGFAAAFPCRFLFLAGFLLPALLRLPAVELHAEEADPGDADDDRRKVGKRGEQGGGLGGVGAPFVVEKEAVGGKGDENGHRDVQAVDSHPFGNLQAGPLPGSGPDILPRTGNSY